jgi:hypothetical protein
VTCEEVGKSMLVGVEMCEKRVFGRMLIMMNALRAQREGEGECECEEGDV